METAVARNICVMCIYSRKSVSYNFEMVGFFFFVSMDQHEEDLETTLSIRGTSESLHTRLMEHLRVKRRELKETTNKLQNLKQQLSSKQTRKRMIA